MKRIWKTEYRLFFGKYLYFLGEPKERERRGEKEDENRNEKR
jgi:hypothetical protein